MEVIKKIACFVLSFIICMCIVCSAMGAAIVLILGNENYWMQSAENTDFYKRSRVSLEEQLKTYSIPSGIPEEVFDGIVPEERIRNDIKMQIVSAKEMSVYSGDDSGLKNQFVSVFEKYAVENGYELSEEVRKNLTGLADICVDEYNSHISISVFSIIMRYVSSYSKSLIVLVGVALGIMVFACIILVLSQKKKALQYISYSMGGAALLTFVPGSIVHIYGIFSKFYFNPDYMYDFLVALVTGMVDILSAVSLAFLILCIVFAVLGTVGKKQKNITEKQEKEES